MAMKIGRCITSAAFSRTKAQLNRQDDMKNGKKEKKRNVGKYHKEAA